jgi:glycosyltransferase involved in cell wall biosynthesis
MSKKIIFINNLYAKHAKGGAEVVVQNLVQEHVQKGWDVHVISLSREKNYAVEVSNGVTIHWVPQCNIYFYADGNNFSFMTRALWRLWDVFNIGTASCISNILKEVQPEVVWTHNLTGLGFVMTHGIKKYTSEWRHTVHDVQLVEPSGLMYLGRENTRLMKAFSLLARNVLNTPDVVISPTQFLKDFYQKWGLWTGAQWKVIPNKIQPIARHNIVKVPSETVRILFVGQVEAHKGIELALEVIKNIPSIRFDIVGDGSILKQLIADYKTSDHITFHGRIAYDEIGTFYKQADYVLLPSLCYENYPTVIAEAHQYGVPVIASNIGGIPEMVQGDDMLFEPGDEEALRSILEGLL